MNGPFKTSGILCRFGLLLLLALAGKASADGAVGDHINDLKGNLENYAREVVWMIEQIDGIVESYQSGGLKGAKPDRVVEIWETVDFHSAIEVNYVPVYASIWQGLFGVKTAIEKEAPVPEVRQQQRILEQALWQALGAVKLASQYQAQGLISAGSERVATTPPEILVEVGQRLDRVLAKYAERLTDEATAIVFDTYLSRFERVEGAIIEQDAELVESLEIDFNVTLPKAMKDGASVDEVRKIIVAMQAKLSSAGELLKAADEKRQSVF